MAIKENIKSSNIQMELNKLRETEPQSSKVTACLFNLIVYTHDLDRAQYFENIVSMIMSQLPCRIIFIQADIASKESYLRVHVSTELIKDTKDVTCEKINIQVGGAEAAKVPFIILPHFIPDLPIYLLWGQDPTSENTILPHLQKYATRLIFDSECSNNLQSLGLRLLPMIENQTIKIVDLNWARIAGWREVLAQVFDSQERLEQLAKADCIKITYNSLPNPYFSEPETQALYLQAWLASRLQWKFLRHEKHAKGYIIHYEGPHPLQIHLIANERKDVLSEDIIGFEVAGINDYNCNITRDGKDQVTIHSYNQFQCERPFSLLLSTLQSGKNFIREIFYQKVSSHYSQMLQLISLASWSKHE
jgi:glucose-6-phosphate dehydrogenase assembly protein OpcA